ncbi:PDDEXK nuclease domain-containing protein [Fusobacterium hominis]|uniref:PDDEXK nuclease domain-containing protein n=1 Tax=Fusobacterium hominis TaxID=2764326 RepID=UPI0022E90370|nr:PDDEXK nuclease domain-containing protein [Fusobacterium hominis]
MEIERKDIFVDIKNIIEVSKKKIVSSINSTITTTYFLIGKRIVEEEQGGVERAEYGKNLIKNLSKKLTENYGKGFSERNLEQMRKFYLTYSISQTVSAEFKLSYSHYLTLMRINNIEERNFYEIEAINNSWSLRELKRQMDSALYERLVLSRDKKKVLELSQKGQLIEKPQDIGHMQMYVNYYDRYVKLDDENKTIGIIICKDKNDTLVNMILPEGNEQIFASRYMTILPSKEELKKIVESEVRE